jgi:hypothetical protein
MAGGYTPVFSSVLDGTLYGKWPHTGVWLCLLSQCDWQGNIDVVPRLLASKIGVSEEELMHCIADFMAPDPGSRTGDLEGRRLELIDPTNRNWGWRVINHGIYREKARKSSYDAERTRSGKDAERKRAEREKAERERAEKERNLGKDAVPRSPDVSRSQTHTEIETQTQIETQTLRKEEGDWGRRKPTVEPTVAPPNIIGASKVGNGKTSEQRAEAIRAVIKNCPEYKDADIAHVAHASLEEVQKVRREQ